MGTQRLSERVSTNALAGGGAVVNEEAGTISNVALCGLRSENGRDYPHSVHQRDHVKYEGAKVYFDHTDGSGRKFRDWVGVVRKPTAAATGSFGLLELFKSDPNVPKLLEAARKCPDKFGMSHVAMCKTRRENGRDVVESIDVVESVDIVTDPATVKGLFRHESRGGAVKISLKQYAERVGPRLGPAKWGALTKLCEDFGDIADAPVVDEPAADAPADGGDLKTALISVITPMLDKAFDDSDATAVCKAVKDFIAMHKKHTGKGGSSTPSDEEPAEESRRRDASTATIAESLAVCKKVGFRGFDATDLGIIGAAPVAEREQVARRLMGSGGDGGQGERPESAGRHQTAQYREEREAADRVRESRGGGGGAPVAATLTDGPLGWSFN